MALADAYDGILFDLDGVLFRADEPVPGAPSTVDALRRRGTGLVFVTNNSARTPEQVAAKLTAMGITASPEEVVTSAQATADLLRRRSGMDGITAYVIGQDGIRTALAEEGIQVLEGEPQRATYVVVGWDGTVSYDVLRRASVLVRSGATLIATNTDAAYPAPSGELWPGAGAILAAVETATGTKATVAGKPHRPLFETAVERLGSRNVLMVGDRVETDIVGAIDSGIDAALVLSGASTTADLLDHHAVPVAVIADVGGLLEDVRPSTTRAAVEEDREPVARLTRELDTPPEWSPDGVWVIGDAEATASVEVRGSDGYLRAVATGEDRRGTGLGTLAVAAAARDARRRGASRLWLLTETAAGFFARLGFERVDRSEVPRWIAEGPGAGCSVAAVPMRRVIAQ